MAMTKIIYYLIILLIFTGCGSAIKKRVVGKYYLIATDVDKDLSLCYHEDSYGGNYSDVIKATVFAVGYNEKYIIVKHHPRAFSHLPNKGGIGYYILPLKKEMDWGTKNGLIGPLTFEQFNNQRNELNISDSLNFSIVYKDLE